MDVSQTEVPTEEFLLRSGQVLVSGGSDNGVELGDTLLDSRGSISE